MVAKHPLRPPEYDDICERVWKGSRDLFRDKFIRAQEVENLRVVVSPEGWATLVTGARDRTRRPNSSAVMGGYDFQDSDGPAEFRMTIFGIRLVQDDSFEPTEVRFRAEVEL